MSADPQKSPTPLLLTKLKNMGLFLAAPFIGVFYIVLMPFVAGATIYRALKSPAKPQPDAPAFDVPKEQK
jgi:hypothetical protein